MTKAIETTSLTKTYSVGFFKKRQVKALRGVDLAVEEGQVFGLLGPNGAGKSTIIKLLLNLLQPSAGKVAIFGQPPSSPEARRVVGYLPENPAPYEYLTGVEFVTFCGRLAGLAGATLQERVREVIETTGMGQAASLQIRRYSKGMTQRICLAQALVASPKVLVLDEPTSGLDVLGRQLVREIILRERKRGTTILLCSHIIPDVEALCDHVAVIVGGQILQQGSVSQLLSTDQNRVDIEVDGIDVEVASQLAKDHQQVGTRWLLRVPDAETSAVLKALLERGARVSSVHRSRYSLEDLFLSTMKESRTRVGSEIQ